MRLGLIVVVDVVVVVLDLSVYQLLMNKQIAHDLERLGLIAFPQHKHLVTAIIIT